MTFSRLLAFTISLLSLLSACQSARQTTYRQIKDFYTEKHFTTTTDSTARFVRSTDSLLQDFPSLQQIALIRHGHPMVSREGKFRRADAQAYVRAYDSVGVYPLEPLPFRFRPEEIGKVFSSPIPRARHTAAQLFGELVPIEEDSIFREFERKIMKYPDGDRKLGFWIGSSRVLWLLGFNHKDIESFRQARKRTRRATALLAEAAEQRQRVVLVAHGFLNRYLAKYLKKEGFELVYDEGRGYGAVKLLVRLP